MSLKHSGLFVLDFGLKPVGWKAGEPASDNSGLRWNPGLGRPGLKPHGIISATGNVANSSGLLGNKSRALSYLEKACDKPINYSLVYLKVNPVWDNLRDDLRFEKLVRRLGLKL